MEMFIYNNTGLNTKTVLQQNAAFRTCLRSNFDIILVDPTGNIYIVKYCTV